jgi:hypothetical protein
MPKSLGAGHAFDLMLLGFDTASGSSVCDQRA